MIDQYKVKGSLTVEATLIFPLFFFVIVGFLYFFQVFQTQTKIQGNITEIAQEASRYGYLYELLTNGKEEKEKEQVKTDDSNVAKDIVTKLVEGSYYKIRFQQLMDGDQELYGVKGGVDGISFLGSSFMEEDGIIEIVASYKAKIPVPFFSHLSFPVIQQVMTRGFIGASLLNETEEEKEENNEEEYVYITKGGKAYHSHKSCTYLTVKISAVDASVLNKLRNKSGGKYYPCESCAKGEPEQKCYYITQYGDRYHTSQLCTRIDRNIITIKKSEVGDRKPCSKCYP